MARMKRNDEPHMAASGAWDGARQAAARVKPLATKVKPLARSTQAAAKRGVHSTRAWAAPQVERTGRVLQDSIAPKVSAMLSSAAQRLEPAQPRRKRWPRVVGISVLTAAAGAAAALARNRRKPDVTTQADDDVTPAAQTHDGQAATPADTDAAGNRQVHTP
jgi:hypothetical protein